MEKSEYLVQLREIINLLYSSLEAMEAAATNMMDTAAIERAALDTLAKPAFSDAIQHQMVTKPGEVGA